MVIYSISAYDTYLYIAIQMTETRKPIPFNTIYKVSNLWNVRTEDYHYTFTRTWWGKSITQTWVKKGRSLKQYSTKFWYLKVIIGKKNYYVHRLVALCFLWLQIDDKKCFVCHKDNNKENNRSDNLYLWNAKINTTQAAADGLLDYNKGESHWLSIYTDDLVREVRRLLKLWHLNQRQIAKKLWVHYNFVYEIKHNKRRKHVL